MTQLLFLDIMTVLKYAALFIVLFIAEIVYLRIAVKLNISDVPNGRSSHKAVTVIGGGIIFWLSMVLASLYFAGPQKIFLIIGITLIAIVSFWDDVVRLKALTRMIVCIHGTWNIQYTSIMGYYSFVYNVCCYS